MQSILHGGRQFQIKVWRKVSQGLWVGGKRHFLFPNFLEGVPQEYEGRKESDNRERKSEGEGEAG